MEKEKIQRLDEEREGKNCSGKEKEEESLRIGGEERRLTKINQKRKI